MSTETNWETLLANQQYHAAARVYTLLPERDMDFQRNLDALADIIDLQRDRLYTRAIERIERIDVPAEQFDWNAIREEIELLKEVSTLIDKRDIDEAIETLGSTEDRYFTAEVLSLLGTALIFQDEPDEAEAAFVRAIELDSRHYRAITNLGNIALERGETDQAIEHYQRALELNDSFPNAYHNLGVAYRKKRQIGKSVQALKKAQKFTQKHDQAEAREQLGKMTGSKNFGKYLKWLAYGVIIAGVYWIFTSQM